MGLFSSVARIRFFKLAKEGEEKSLTLIRIHVLRRKNIPRIPPFVPNGLSLSLSIFYSNKQPLKNTT